MSAKSLSDIFVIGIDVLSAALSAAKSTILAQTGDAVTGDVDSNNDEWYQHTGFASMPAPPTPGQPGCQAVKIRQGNNSACIASRDLRNNGIYGNLKPGEACLFAPGAQGRVICKSDGAITQLTTDDNTPTGNTVLSRLSPIERRFYAPFGQEWQDTTGYHLRTWHGASIDMGGLGLPAPFDIYKSSIRISADMINLDAAVLTLGRTTGTSLANPVVQASPQFATVMGGLITALGAIDVAFAAISAYAVAIKAIADPTNAATPTLTAAMTAVAIPVGASAASLPLLFAPNPVGCASSTSIA